MSVVGGGKRTTSSAGYSLATAAGAATIPRSRWDSLASRGFHRHRWFVTTEAHGHEAAHVLVEREGEPVALFPFYRRRAELYGDLHHRWLGPARDVLDSVSVTLRPSRVSAPPLATISEPLGRHQELPRAVLDRVVDVVEAAAWQDGAAALVWPFLSADCEKLLEVLRDRGYATAFEGSRAVLEVTWDSLEDYVESLGSSTRRTVRRELEEVDGEALEVDAREDFRGIAGELGRRYRSFYRERNGREPPLAPDFFERLAEDPGEGVWVQVAARDGELLTASVMLEAGGTVDGTLAAYAEETLGGPLYHHDLVYAPVRRVAGPGVRRIDLGPGSLYPKVLRGADLEPRTTAVLGRTSAHRAALRVLARAVSARNRQKEERAVGDLLG